MSKESPLLDDEDKVLIKGIYERKGFSVTFDDKEGTITLIKNGKPYVFKQKVFCLEEK